MYALSLSGHSTIKMLNLSIGIYVLFEEPLKHIYKYKHTCQPIDPPGPRNHAQIWSAAADLLFVPQHDLNNTQVTMKHEVMHN